MMVAMNGMIQGNRIVVDEDISKYNGNNVIVTVLNKTVEKTRQGIDLSRFHVQTERGRNVDEYMKEMRDNDRF